MKFARIFGLLLILISLASCTDFFKEPAGSQGSSSNGAVVLPSAE